MDEDFNAGEKCGDVVAPDVNIRQSVPVTLNARAFQLLKLRRPRSADPIAVWVFWTTALRARLPLRQIWVPPPFRPGRVVDYSASMSA